MQKGRRKNEKMTKDKGQRKKGKKKGEKGEGKLDNYLAET